MRGLPGKKTLPSHRIFRYIVSASIAGILIRKPPRPQRSPLEKTLMSSAQNPLASGIVAAAVLPFENNGAIDWLALERYIAEVAAGGPRAIAMNMDASEGYSLSLEEQLEVIRRCRPILAGTKVKLLSGLLIPYTIGAVDFARRLVDAGAEGLTLFPPFPVMIGRPTVAMVLDYHGAVNEAVDVPLVAFQLPPAMVDYPKGTFAELSKLKNMVAIKEASFDISRTRLSLMEAAAAPRKLGILTGSDTLILEAMLIGCDGALIGFAGAFTAELVRMHLLAQSGDVANAWGIWKKLGQVARFGWEIPIREARVRMKYILELQGLIPNSYVRGPAMPMSSEEKKTLADILRNNDLLGGTHHPAGRAARYRNG